MSSPRATGQAIPDLKALSLKNDGNAISPFDTVGITASKYPLLRPLFHYTNGRPAPNVLNFIRFELSDEGQAIVERQGFLRINDQYKKQNESKLADENK